MPLAALWLIVAAQAPDPTPPGLSAGVSGLFYGSYNRSAPLTPALELASHVPLRGAPLELFGGFRFASASATVSFPVEVFAGARLVGAFGLWRPAAGPEVGASGFARLPPRGGGFPDDLDALEDQRLSPFYLAFDAAPLRFLVGDLTLSLLEVSVGSSLGVVGTAIRVELSFLNLTVAL